MVRLKVGIAALQETRLAKSSTLRENNYTFFWRGKASDQIREHGIGFAVKNTLLNIIEPGEIGTERILAMQLHTTDGPVNLVSVYAPTLYSPQDIKDKFNNRLHH